MKKLVLALVVLMFAQTVQALDVWCTVGEGIDSNLITLHYSGASAGPVRGMAFDITVDGDLVISDVQCLSANYGYQIYPGSIAIDSSGNVSDWGSCKCSGDLPGTLDEPNAMTIEMAAMYEDGVDPDPCDAGDLASFRIEGSYGLPWVTITVNEIRGGVVNEDASVEVSPILTGCGFPPWHPCWDEYRQCGGQPKGDGTCDGAVNFLDLGQLKQAFFSSKGQPNYNCCADYNHDESVNFLDLAILKTNFFSTGYDPSTGGQDCPP